MKPNFALDLSHDGISLLHRGKGGWTLVGEVALDDPDMGAHLDAIRRSAAELESGGFTTKLILPNSQILYTTIEAPGPDDIAREVQIRAGLDGLTPYAVGDLVFDWRAEGDKARVAVLARETMDEAENFAAEYRLNPVSFVARPGSGEFSGEPFFGLTRAATRLIASGERLVPDASPVPRRPRALELPAEARVEPPLATVAEASVSEPADAEPMAAESIPPEPDPTEPTPPPETGSEPSWPAQSEPAPRKAVPPSELAPSDPFAVFDRPESEAASELPALDTNDTARAARRARRARAAGGDRVSPPALAPFPPTPDEAEPTPRPVQRVEPIAKPKAAPPVNAPLADPAEPKPVAGPALDDVPPPPSVSFSSRRGSDEPGSAERVAAIAPRIGVAPSGATVPPATAKPLAPAEAPEHGAPAAPAASRRVELPPRPKNFGDSPAERMRAQMADALAKPLPSPETPLPPKPRSPALPSGLGATLGGLMSRVAKPRLKSAAPVTAVPVTAAPIAALQPAGSVPQPPLATPPEAEAPPAPAAAKPAKAPKPAKPPKPTKKPKPDTPGRKAARGGDQRAREAEALTVFGARKTREVRGKPRYLGLVLTLVLLLVMAAAAIWSSFLLNGNDAELFNPSPEVATAPAAAPEPQAGADLPPVEVEPDTPAPVVIDEIAPEPDTGEVLTAEAAEARYAATGIWQRAPEALAAPDAARIEDLTLDPIGPLEAPRASSALPRESAVATEAPPAAPLAPPPPGTTFDLDENGLVRATPEGAVSPTGILVHSGKPPVVPPPRPVTAEPEAAAEPAATPDTATAEATAPDTVLPETTAADVPSTEPAAPQADPGPVQLPGIPATRPPARPADLATDTAAVTPAATPATAPADDETGSDLAALAEAADEAVDQAVAAAFAGSTELAVAASRLPTHRPSGFDRIVDAAQASASDGSSVVAAVVTPASASVGPILPTTASVAREATVSNALNLRDINLIGIYGTPNARRALVRLENGRYLKVQVGDRLDGGKVTSISASRLTYQKGNRAYALDVLPLG